VSDRLDPADPRPIERDLELLFRSARTSILRDAVGRVRAELAAVRQQLDEARYIGDNHHNAAACPHCGDLLGRSEAALRETRQALAIIPHPDTVPQWRTPDWQDAARRQRKAAARAAAAKVPEDEQEHGRCLYCCICFKVLTPDECVTDMEGVKWDACKGECAKEAGIVGAALAAAGDAEDTQNPPSCTCGAAMSTAGLVVVTEHCPIHGADGTAADPHVLSDGFPPLDDPDDPQGLCCRVCAEARAELAAVRQELAEARAIPPLVRQTLEKALRLDMTQPPVTQAELRQAFDLLEPSSFFSSVNGMVALHGAQERAEAAERENERLTRALDNYDREIAMKCSYWSAKGPLDPLTELRELRAALRPAAGNTETDHE